MSASRWLSALMLLLALVLVYGPNDGWLGAPLHNGGVDIIFAVPGMGSAVLNAVVNRDFPVIQGFTLVISAFFLFANIMADLFYALLDPRIRY